MLLISEYLRQMLCQKHITYSVLTLYQYNEDDSSISAELISNKFVLIQDKQREPVNYEINKENLLTMINKENLLTMTASFSFRGYVCFKPWYCVK